VSSAVRLAKVAAIGAAACFAYGAVIETRSFRVRRVCLDILPAGSDAIRVLHISDLHLLARQEAKLRFVSELAGLEPDLVVNTGDNIAEPTALAPLLSALAPLLEVPGVFVFGSNDYTGPELKNPLGYLVSDTGRDGVHTDRTPLPTEELRAGLAAGGWQDLVGRRASIEVRGVRLEFRGTDDAHLGLDDYALVAGPKTEGARASIGVTHAPYKRVLDAMTDDGVQLIMAGHTHGGQVCIPGWGALTTNCDLPPAQAKGLSSHQGAHGSSWLHVSAGLGSSPYAPYRFACPPEVTLLTLRPVSNG
jgi:uncharacterized protein